MTDIRSGGIYWVHMDKIRPAVVLTRDVALPYLSNITVAPIFTKVRGLRTEVIVDERNGLDHESAVNLDNVQTVSRSSVFDQIGLLTFRQKRELAWALVLAFDLEIRLRDI
ncbi:type II toxin-antitoxin system PemK/MazF family toxin [Corynebacterium meitnerae]